jgi:signal transduction histidine kinase
VEKIVLPGKNLHSLSQPTKPEMRDVDLAALLEQTTETLAVSGVLKRLHVVKDYEKDLPKIHGDANLLEQVVRNLEINSAHAMESGGTLTVGCRLSTGGDQVEMFIRDTGPGIASEIRDRIFEPFFTTKSEGKGTGLGLPIVKQIVEQHGGRLVVDSEPGKGTAVIISLPVSGSAAEGRGS